MAIMHRNRSGSGRRVDGLTLSVIALLSLLSSHCGAPPPDEPGAPDDALFELDGQDLVIEVPDPEGSGPRTVRVKHLPETMDGELYLHSDDALRVGEGGITIRDLQALAHEAPRDSRYADLLVTIFNDYGVSMSYLPRGFSAGLGASIDLSDNVDASDALEHLTGRLWFGKYFEPPDQCLRVTRGANRIGESLRIDFVARLIPQHAIGRFVMNPSSLGIDARSNFVDLNYASALPEQRRTALDQPNTHTTDRVPVLRRLAGLVQRLGVYDLGVMIPGRYGPILVGRTWLGEYADNAEQTYSASSLDGRQIAWFFLDFNEGAVGAQEAPSDSQVEYTAKRACERRPVSSEDSDLPAPRPL